MSPRILLLPAAVLFGLGACGSAPAEKAAPASAVPAVAPTTAAPAAATTPASKPPGRTAPTKAPMKTSKEASTEVWRAAPRKASRTAKAPACPSAAQLERLVDLPEGWSLIPSSVQCWRNWAWAGPKRTSPADGFYLFQHTGTGWRFHSEGSGYHCDDLGLREDAPFCW